jgi:hypothetical protein
MAGEYLKEVMASRGKELEAKGKENAKVRASETSSAGKTYQGDPTTPIRREASGRHEGLDTSDVLRGTGAVNDLRINKALKDD